MVDPEHPLESRATNEDVRSRRRHGGNHSSPLVADDDDLLATCGVYFAPSTIPGAGMGTFAGRSFRAGDEVTPGDAVVPLRDMAWHHGGNDHTDTFLWGTYGYGWWIV